jgi:hypothetical protein
MKFVVADDPPPPKGQTWRFAGRGWQPGEDIWLCMAHAHDVYMTIGATSPDQVAEWLRPDAADPPNTWRWNQSPVGRAAEVAYTLR